MRRLYSSIIGGDDILTSAVIDLLRIGGMNISQRAKITSELLSQTDRRFRQVGKVLADVRTDSKMGQRIPEIKRKFASLGMVFENCSDVVNNAKYDYVLLFGATLKGVMRRLAELRYMVVHEQVAVKTVVLMTSLRKLRDNESSSNLRSVCDDWDIIVSDQFVEGEEDWLTEADMMEGVWRSVELPVALREASLVRACPEEESSTDSSLDAFLADKPIPGSVLAVTSNPAGRRMSLVTWMALVEGGFTSSGLSFAFAKAPDSLNVGQLYSELHKTLYQISELQRVGLVPA